MCVCVERLKQIEDFLLNAHTNLTNRTRARTMNERTPVNSILRRVKQQQKSGY